MVETLNLFWFLHQKPVINYFKELAKKYNANLEAVWLSAILHNLVRLNDLEPHDEIGLERDYNLLLERVLVKKLQKRLKRQF